MLGLTISPMVMGIGGLIVALLIVGSLIVKRFKLVDPSEAMIIVGNRSDKKTDNGQIDPSGQKVITGGRAFVWPLIQKEYYLSLESRQLDLATTGQTKNGITLRVTAVATITIGNSEEMIRAAAQRFLNKQEQIEISSRQVLSGSLRSILGSLTITEIIQDRQAVASHVLSEAQDALSKQGLMIDALRLLDIDDDGTDYIRDLGRPEAAAVRQAAEIADTEANRAAQEAKINADKQILVSSRELELKKSEVKTETDTASARAEAARPLEDAQQKRLITEQETITAGKQAELEEQRLNATVRKQADAEAYRLTKIAEADANAQIARANAERDERKALADAARSEGIAEAEVITAKGLAEAEATKARAEALADSEAVLAQQLIASLPEMVRGFGEAYSGIDNLTVVSADGANKLTGDMVGNMATMQEMVKSTTGIDIASLVTGRETGRAIGEGVSKTPPPAL